MIWTVLEPGVPASAFTEFHSEDPGYLEYRLHDAGKSRQDPVLDGGRRAAAPVAGHMNLETSLVNAARDARGIVFEPLNAAELAVQRNVHVVITEPGQVRGNHYHKSTTEILIVLGPALVRIRAEDGLKDFLVAAGQIRRFVIPPGIPHAIRHDGLHAGMLVSFSTRPHDPQNPDTYREVLLGTP